jgi:hypothetical protein
MEFPGLPMVMMKMMLVSLTIMIAWVHVME